MPPAERGAGQREPVARVDPLKAVQRLVVLPAAHDGVGEHARAGPAAQDGQVRRVADQHLDRPLARGVLGDELRPDHAHDDARRPPALEHLGHLFPDAAEVLEALLLHLVRDQLDVDPGKMRGQRLAAARLPALMRPDALLLDELRGAVLREQCFEQGQRELAVVITRDALGLLPEQALLELLVVFPKLLVEGLVLIAGGDRSGQRGFECGDPREGVVCRRRHGPRV